jgi:hypothetical protein
MRKLPENEIIEQAGYINSEYKAIIHDRLAAMNAATWTIIDKLELEPQELAGIVNAVSRKFTEQLARLYRNKSMGKIRSLATVRREASMRRVDTVMNYLRKHGPSYFCDICRDTGVPKGSVQYIISRYDNIKRAPDGLRWMVVGNK